MSWNFELVAGPFGGTTEGPVWDGEAVLYTNIPASRILRYNPNLGDGSQVDVGQLIFVPVYEPAEGTADDE